MSIDFYSKSQQLLESLANSIHDREKNTLNTFFFNSAELHLTEKWLREFIKEAEKERT